MKRSTLTSNLALVSMVLGACSDAPLMGPDAENPNLSPSRPQDSRAAVRIPVHGRWINAEDPLTPKAGCVLHFTTSQEGRATHIGSFVGQGATCVPAPPVDASAPPPGHTFTTPADVYSVARFENEMTWTTPGGDELWLNPNSGEFVASSAGEVSAIGILRIGGGTGRFAGASGQLRVRNVDGSPFHLEFEGWISPARGGRR